MSPIPYAALAATDTVLTSIGERGSRARWLTKPALMPVLAAGLARRAGTDDPAVRRTLLAQALSCAGDVALRGRSEAAFLTGVASFFGAHVAYLGAYSARGSRDLLTDSRSRGVLALGVALNATMAVAAARRDPRFGPAVAAYGVVLATMGASAVALPDGPGSAQAKAGAALFLLSDSLLGTQMFLRDEPHPMLEAAVMATYTAGQWLISEGMAAGAR